MLYASTGTTATWRKVWRDLKAVHAKLQRVHVGQTFVFGKARATVLSPSGLSDDPNENSVVLLTKAGGRRFLFTGDLTGPNEDTVGNICAGAPRLYLLKVAHHGSAYSTSASFLADTRPRFAVISVGHNSYGHPSPSTIARLRAAHVRIYTTRRNGSITVTVRTSGAVTWTFSRSRRPV